MAHEGDELAELFGCQVNGARQDGIDAGQNRLDGAGRPSQVRRESRLVGAVAPRRGEDIEVMEVALDAAVAMIADGRIIDAKTIMLVQQLVMERVLRGAGSAAS